MHLCQTIRKGVQSEQAAYLAHMAIQILSAQPRYACTQVRHAINHMRCCVSRAWQMSCLLMIVLLAPYLQRLAPLMHAAPLGIQRLMAHVITIENLGERRGLGLIGLLRHCSTQLLTALGSIVQCLQTAAPCHNSNTSLHLPPSVAVTPFRRPACLSLASC
jgi:hypothetical protein